MPDRLACFADEKNFSCCCRSNEKRKERSRDAARCRRSMETDIFTELAAALPVAPEQAALLDKASVMRLAIAYLKVRTVVDSSKYLSKYLNICLYCNKDVSFFKDTRHLQEICSTRNMLVINIDTVS